MTETLSKKTGTDPDVYRLAQEEVLKRLEASTDRLGRSMKWKAEAIREDLADKKDNTYTQEFAKEVIALAEKYL
jgi:hypothetical protein